MYIQVGAPKESDFRDPLGLLHDCHRRIERFLQALIVVAGRGGELDEAHRHALEAALRYFREAAPLHTRDEEESLFPRMRAAGATWADGLEADHEEAEAAHAEVEALGREWLASGTLPASAAERMRLVLERLASLYARHIDLEDREVFPLARGVLAEGDLEAIGREMAARRGVPFERK